MRGCLMSHNQIYNNLRSGPEIGAAPLYQLFEWRSFLISPILTPPQSFRVDSY